jgi:hypothetical protein
MAAGFAQSFVLRLKKGVGAILVMAKKVPRITLVWSLERLNSISHFKIWVEEYRLRISNDLNRGRRQIRYSHLQTNQRRHVFKTFYA